MCKIGKAFSYSCSAISFGVVLFLLTDLAYFGRIAKLNSFWQFACNNTSENRLQVCMAHYDVCAILIFLCLLTITVYSSIKEYGWKIVFLPFWGCILYVILCRFFLNWI